MFTDARGLLLLLVRLAGPAGERLERGLETDERQGDREALRARLRVGELDREVDDRVRLRLRCGFEQLGLVFHSDDLGLDRVEGCERVGEVDETELYQA